MTLIARVARTDRGRVVERALAAYPGLPDDFHRHALRATSRIEVPMASRTAACCCGQLRIEVQGETLGVGVCHCLACQQRTGSVFATLAGFAAPFTVHGNATEFVRTGDEGAAFRFRFCPICGSTVFHTEEGHDDLVMVAVGAFADPHFPAPQDSVYECRRHAWVRLPEQIERYPKNPT